MRSIFLAAPILLLAAACSSTPASSPVAATKPAAAPVVAKGPQCYNGDSGSFDAVGTKTSVAGVKVECKLTSDGKSATWHGAK